MKSYGVPLSLDSPKSGGVGLVVVESDLNVKLRPS